MELTNRYTASHLIDRALHIADIANTDFLTYSELIDYLNDAWKNVCQIIVEYGLNVFTSEVRLAYSNGVYELPFDCWQIRSVRDPLSGRLILRKTDSQSDLSNYYEVVNNTIRIGGNSSTGPVVLTYWRKPFFLSFPNKTIDADINGTILDTNKNNILLLRDDTLYLYNPLSAQELELDIAYDESIEYKLTNNAIILIDKTSNTLIVGDLNGKTIYSTETLPDLLIKSDSGLIYFGFIVEHVEHVEQDDNTKTVQIKLLDKEITTIDYIEGRDYLQIDNEFYAVPENSFPLGVFDDRPAYINDDVLYLINPDGSLIEEELNTPTLKIIGNINYGIIGVDGKIYSNVPDTLLNFPNNLFYDLIAYNLAVRFLCKQNADSQGVENLFQNALLQLKSSIDVSADYPRLKLARRR